MIKNNPFSISLGLFAATFLVLLSVKAEEPVVSVRAGPELAVEEAKIKEGFRLKEKAKKNIGVVTQTVGPGPFSLPASGLVYFGDNVGVYRVRSGWFKLIHVTIDKKAENLVSFHSSDLQEGDEVAIKGGALLRVSEMDAFGGAE